MMANRIGILLLWCLLNSASAASPEEIQVLQDVAAKLGTSVWNLTSDPCSGKWQGVNCCLKQELDSNPCCTTIYKDPTKSSCTVSSVNSTIVGVNLDSNYNGGRGRMLTGFLPDSICNLTSLVTLDLNNNFLSGQIPRCIGKNLSRLKKLGLAGGNLAGGIPEELGELRSLEEIYLDNNNLTGSIPSSIGGMSSLRSFNIRNNRLGGEIPSELGRLTNLTEIQLQVNNLSGTIASLASLTGLRILNGFRNNFSGELSMSIFQNLSSLERLALHQNKFTGVIPALDERFVNLTYLDLGFNQISGHIPGSLSRLPSLKNLFLGHNNLSGSIPPLASENLVILDVSHNSLTGSLPTLPQDLQVDFSFNSLDTANASTTSGLIQDGKSYFNCLPSSNSSTNTTTSCIRSQRGRSTLFAIHAGNPNDIRNKDGTLFQKDAISNQTGLHYLEANDNWALEISGEFSGTFQTQSKIKAPPEDDPELYQTMRWSSSYMAYHGSNLQNGVYNVTLYFCEFAFQNATFRAFDVLLQGKAIAMQLDLAKEVGALTAYKITENATVTEGSLSIEFVNNGYDRYLDPKTNRVTSSGPIISAILIKSLDHVSSSSSSAWKKAVLASVLTSLLVIFILLMIITYRCKKSRRKLEDGNRPPSWCGAAGTTMYSYKELDEATDGFSAQNKLGQGGFGSVYKGKLENETLVAVKQLLHQNQQGREAFKKEIEILSSVQHRNLVAVRGYCLDAEHPMLVCDYFQNGSLDQFLHGSKGFLTWKQRQMIAMETALALAYLHDESKHRIIHCDMKPPNILLDDDFHPRIADFGMARLYEEGRSHVTATRMGGTIGYLAPEYAMHYQLSDKADVYSFGVVILELISGRRAVESSAPLEQVVLVEYAHNLAAVSAQDLAKLLDKRLEADCESSEVVDMARIAVLCTLESPLLRPKMRSVWLMLKGTLEIPEIPLTLDTRFSTVRALLSAYDTQQQSSSVNSQERLIAISPR